MEAVAERYFNIGDMKSAATFYGNLMMLHPRYVRMARICRVLADPLAVPLPHRYADVVEALLEPSITPEALFGVDATPADVNKAYQRWTLLVHPDKNPYPRAGDAFNRLVSLKAGALESVGNTRKEESNFELFGREEHSRRGNHRHKKRGSPDAQSRSNESNTPSLRAAEIDMTISELKKVQVTLKSLKRKNIDDSELPELSVSLRGVRERRFFAQPTSPLASTAPNVPRWDLDSEARGSPHPTTTNTTSTNNTTNTTSTSLNNSHNNNIKNNNSSPVVPSPPVVSVDKTPQRASTAKPSHQTPQVGIVGGEREADIVPERVQSQQRDDVNEKESSVGREVRTTKNNARQPQEANIDGNRSRQKTATDEGRKVTAKDAQSTKSGNKHLQETTSEKNRFRRRAAPVGSKKDHAKQCQEVVGEKNRSRRKTDDSENTKVTSKDAPKTKYEPKELQEEMIEEDHLCRKTDASEKKELLTTDKQYICNDVEQLQLDVPPSQTVLAVSEEVSLVDVAREGIHGLIRGLEEIKLNRVPLRLNLDLTFATYEREKQEKESSCSEKKQSP
ncbi:hypothetical protein LSM04_000964 [Trypanosoma melophagium]|uniref:uncharacterized protein n=1 Tax=Trypanosoma melophagium TaxID=715481 RepID=UPI00351A980F|nr:hypothetical protein LSM04_000964 [Trypanosoma melophagium]